MRSSRQAPGLAALAAAMALGLAAVALLVYSVIELRRFERVDARYTALVYAAPLTLVPGADIGTLDLAGALARLHYTQTRGAADTPGQFRRGPGGWDLHRRGLDAGPRRIRLEVRDGRITRITGDGREVARATLEPEVLTSAGDRTGEEHRPVRLADVPPVLVQAVLAAEDHRFFAHRGLDLHGLIRAAWANLRAGRVRQGGSTITQQLVKTRLLDPRRTLTRKLEEAWLATLVEWRYSKDRILEAYLNEVYLGQRGTLALRGMGAAAPAFFGKEIHQLTLAEAALLAAIVRAPNSYSPSASPDRARERRDRVLARMRELGFIGDAELEAARRTPVRVARAAGRGQLAPYFTDQVRQELESRYGPDLLSTRDVRIFTTLDLPLQRLAERAVARGLDRLDAGRIRAGASGEAHRLQAALVALDATTGQIRALVGGRDYQASQFNRVTLAHRQPGSAFKPFVYATALAPAGAHRPAFTAASFVDDAPLTLIVNGAPWSPRNHGDRYRGRVTLREALEQSLNAATVRLAQDVGLPAIVDRARDFGIRSRLEAVPAVVLGAFEVTPLELAAAYLPLANGGRRPPAAGRTISAVRQRGEALEAEDGEGEGRAVLSAAQAYVMTSLLEGVLKSGTGAAARALIPGPIAGKTGTTNDGRDAWFVGYSPALVTAVWVGYDSGAAHGQSGAELALPIWAEFMRTAAQVRPAREWAAPAGVTFLDIDLTNGLAANRFCPRAAREVFVAGTEPAPCQEHGGLGDRVEEQIQRWWGRIRDWFRR